MQIRLLKRIGLGGGRIGEAGSIHVLTDNDAMELINRGIAVRFTPVEAPPERNTAVEPTNTRTAARGGRKRG